MPPESSQSEKYIAATRESNPEVVWDRVVWNKFTPFRINCFMWRLFQNALPVDANIQTKGIALASRCVCCANPKLETMDHLFINSDIAIQFRKAFAPKLHKCVTVNSVHHLLHSWLHGFSLRAQCGYTTLGIIFFGLWEIWKHRCRLKFEGESFDSSTVICANLHHIQERNALYNPKRNRTVWESNILDTLGIQTKEVHRRKGRWVAWQRPPFTHLNLNIDASVKNQVARVGGVVRDTNGDVVFAFADSLNPGEILAAELEGIFKGIQLCRDRNLWNIILETDSEMAYNLISNQHSKPGKYTYMVRRIWRLLDIQDLKLTFRQGNMVADGVAKLAHIFNQLVEWRDLGDLPSAIQKRIFFYRIGLPYFRPKCN